MIVIYDNDVVIARETVAFVGEKIVAAATGESSSVHVDHDRAFTRTVNLRCPNIDAQAVFTRHSDCRSAMKEKAVFVGVRQVLSIHIEVRGVVLWADAADRKSTRLNSSHL